MNHNPDTSKFSVDTGLALKTATVTYDPYSARNSLTHRILAPNATVTIAMDASAMADGRWHIAALSHFRDDSAYIGVSRSGSSNSVIMVNNFTMNADWSTRSNGTIIQSTALNNDHVWLRAFADVQPAFTDTTPGETRMGTFSYNTNGEIFTLLGEPLLLSTTYFFFMAYRSGILNYATKELGGSVVVNNFTMEGFETNLVT